MSKSVLLKSSLAKKYWMGLTGLFLCFFLVGHLLGNLQLLLPEDKAMLNFNAYAKFMTTFPLIKVLSYLTYFSILFHAADGILLAIQNYKARPVKYAYNNPSVNSSWSSRNMAFLGFVLLFFLVIHMRSFWYEMHYGILPIDSEGNKNLYQITVSAFQNLYYVLFYVICLLAIAFHLFHGIQSAFKSLGLSSKSYNPYTLVFSYAFSIIVPLLFAAIPVTIYLRSIL